MGYLPWLGDLDYTGPQDPTEPQFPAGTPHLSNDTVSCLKTKTLWLKVFILKVEGSDILHSTICKSIEADHSNWRGVMLKSNSKNVLYIEITKILLNVPGEICGHNCEWY